MTEEWRAVPGCDGYLASSDGRICTVGGAFPHVEQPKRNREYPRIFVGRGRERRRYMVHVLVARAFLGWCPEGYQHNHKDGNKSNSRPENLEFVTPRQNIRHAFDVLGVRINQGSKHGCSRLVESQVAEIRKRRAGGESLKTLAAAFGVSLPTISMIASHKTWRHMGAA